MRSKRQGMRSKLLGAFIVPVLSFRPQGEIHSRQTGRVVEANGHRSFPKERLEVFGSGGIIQLDNFRKMTAWGWPGFRSMNVRSQDKGNAACAAAFVHAIETGGPAPIALDEILEVAERTFDVAEALGMA